MINTASIQTARTAGEMNKRLKDLLAAAEEEYGKDTREFNAFKELLDHDLARAVEAQVKYLNEQLQRYQRECSEWLAIMPL